MANDFRRKIQQLRAAQETIVDLEALLEVSKLLHATIDVSRLFTLIVEKAIVLTNADRGCLMTMAEEGTYRVEVARDKDGACISPEAFRVSDTIVRAVTAQKSALNRTDAWDDAHLSEQTSVRDPSIRMVLAAPVLIDGEVAGLIYVDSANPGQQISEQRLQTLEALAGQSAIALQQALLYGEIKALYQKTKILDRAKLDFIQIASHELRTPLSLIQGYAAMLPEMVASTEETEPVIRGILDGARRLAGMVDLMLAVSEADQQSLALHIYDYSLRDLVAQETANRQQALDERCLTLEMVLEPAGDPLLWPVDPERLKTALSHLIQNAIKFTPDGGTITVRARKADSLWLEVADTGIGISPEYRAAIFEKFYRIGDVGHHSTGDTKFMGAGPGLGLFLVRGIVEAHGGKVWVQDNNGAGSRFMVRLPGSNENE